MSTQRRGAISCLVAVSLVAIFGVVAIALDGGLLFDNHRRVQSAADAAALAAADDLFANFTANGGTDPLGTAAASARATAAANGYNNDGVTSVVTVNIPPTSGFMAGKPGYAEVILQFNQKRGFSSIFGSSDLPVKARSVAAGIPGNIGILILDPHLQGALEIRGNVTILNGGQLYSNSDNTTPNDAASQGATGSVYVGPGITLKAGGINVFNRLVADGTVIFTNPDGSVNPSGAVATYTVLKTDPLADIPEPTKTGLVNHGSVTVTTNKTLQPGIYTNLTIGSGTKSPTVTLAPGLYWIDKGGSLNVNNGTLQGTGVMIVNNTQQDTVCGWNNPASGVINLTPPTDTTGGTWPTGANSSTYAGISMWVPRSWNQEVHFQSTANATVTGTWYAQGAEYDIRANGPSVVFNIGNYICDLGEWNQKYGGGPNTGTGTIYINPGTAAPTLRPTLVE
jgi:hypothetical protein